MDNRFGEMQIFLAVAHHGSLAGAARQLRLTPSAVSRALSRLEARLDVQLVVRTTRALSLTGEGEAYRDRVAGLMEELDDLERVFDGSDSVPQGMLRIDCSVPFGSQFLLPVLPTFRARHPGVIVNLTLSDAVADIVETRADIAIRVGPLRDTGLKAKKLGRSTKVLVASPDYLARRGTPHSPHDLAAHDCLHFSSRRSLDSWPCRIGGRLVQRPVEPAFLGNSGDAVRLMAVAGGGLARLGRFHVAADLAAGRLVEVLPEFNPGDEEEIHALFVGHHRLAARVRAFLDFLEAEIALP